MNLDPLPPKRELKLLNKRSELGIICILKALDCKNTLESINNCNLEHQTKCSYAKNVHTIAPWMDTLTSKSLYAKPVLCYIAIWNY